MNVNLFLYSHLIKPEILWICKS